MRLYEAVAIRIVELCNERGITINALADICGMPSANLKNIQYGRSKNPGLKIIIQICNGLDISMEEFFHSEVFKDYKYFEEIMK
mgnify:CR=1 FL=1